MTRRDFFEKVITLVNETEIEKYTELKEYAESEIEKMNARNAKRVENPTKNQQDNKVIKDLIVDFLKKDMDAHLSSEIAAEVEISVQKANALLYQLVKENMIVSEEVKVPKKGKQKAYRLV